MIFFKKGISASWVKYESSKALSFQLSIESGQGYLTSMILDDEESCKTKASLASSQIFVVPLNYNQFCMVAQQENITNQQRY